MPDLTVESIAVCPQFASNWEVQSRNPKSKEKYLAQFQPNAESNCSCKSYKFSGDQGEQNCKHLDDIREHGCFWSGDQFGEGGKRDWFDHGLTLLSTSKHTLEDKCPGCGEPMVGMIIAV